MKNSQAINRLPAGLRKTLCWIGAVLVCLPPAALLILGLYGLIFGSLYLSWGGFVLFFLIPGLILFRMVWLLREWLRPVGSKALHSACLLALLFFVVWTSRYWTAALPLEYHDVTTDRAVERLTEEYPNFTLIQSLDLGQPKEVRYHECERLGGALFDTKVFALQCRYGANYETVKAQMEAGLTFREEQLQIGDPDEKLHPVDPDLRIGDDRFRFVDPAEESGMWFPKDCILFVTNDARREITILRYSDNEIDYVEDLEDFIRNECCWKMIS